MKLKSRVINYKIDKKNIQYIRAKERGWDYAFEGIKNMGYMLVCLHLVSPMVYTLSSAARIMMLWIRLSSGFIPGFIS